MKIINNSCFGETIDEKEKDTEKYLLGYTEVQRVFCIRRIFMDVLVVIVIVLAILSLPLVLVVGIGCLPFIVLTALFILGVKMVINPWFSNRKKSRLDQNHILIIPQKQVVRVDANINFNGYNPYVIDCYYTDENTGRQFVFTSKPFMTDPTPYLNGVNLGVFVNPEDYSNYYVDVSKLPPNI